MARDYIPRPNGAFFDFQENIVQKVVAKAAAWNIPASEVNALSSASAAYGNHYQSISIKQNRTSAQVAAHKVFRKTYEKDLRQFVNGYIRANKNVSIEDLSNMRIKIRSKRRKHRSAIDTAPVVFMQSVPGAWLKFWCRVESKEGKASIHPESDGVEICFSVGTMPGGPEDCAHSLFQKKAHIRLPIKPAWRGKMFYGYMRWQNLSNDSLSGPWCQVVLQQVY